MATTNVTTSEEYKKHVEESKGVVLVDFWAEWCPPCKALSPLLVQIDEDFGDEVDIVKVDVDKSQALAMEQRVQAMPTVKLYKDGVDVGGWIGLQPKSVYVEAIEANM